LLEWYWYWYIMVCFFVSFLLFVFAFCLHFDMWQSIEMLCHILEFLLLTGENK
jgi:hypothetical protein